MKYIETDFTKELSVLLKKHKKTFSSDKSGIYILDDEYPPSVITTESETASEDSRSLMLLMR